MTLILDPENPLATKVQTRDGRKARIICVDRRGNNNQPIVALVGDLSCQEGTREDCFSYCIDGKKQFPWIDETGPADLINVPETRSWWVNFYNDGPYMPHATREIADERMSQSRVALIEIRMCGDRLIEAVQHEIKK